MVFVREGQRDSSQARSAWRAWPSGPCPEGAIRLSPGFQPWEALSKRICPEGARDHGTTDGWHYTCDLGSGAPSGLFAGEIRFPGLKPWAESSCPFGTKNHPKLSLSSCHSPWAESYRP